MAESTAKTFRFVFISMSGLLFVGATASWHSLGYLSPKAWFLEWGDVLLAFVCVYLATRTEKVHSAPFSLFITGLALILSFGSYFSAVQLPVFTSLGTGYYYSYAFPVAALVGLFVSFYRYKNRERLSSFLFFLALLGSIMYITYLFYLVSPVFPTDESVIDLYSSHLFLSGLNPYNTALSANAFNFYNFPIYDTTPMATGGYVTTLTYPALSFIALIPAEVLHVKTSLIMYPFFAVPMILVWYRAWSKKQWIESALILLPFLSLSIYTSQVEFDDLNIVWVSLLMASYFLVGRTKVSGVLFGLALSVKQFPAIAVPFLLYFIFREYGWKKSIVWIIAVIGSFLAINGYFMAIGMHSFVTAMLENEFAPLIGVGFGPAQLSFLGLVEFSKTYFTLAMFATLLISLVAYIFYYGKLKYALFVFPILVFFFNYRLFVQYIFYWMIISLLPMVDLLVEQKNTLREASASSIEKVSQPRNFMMTRKRARKVVAVLLFVILAGTVGAGYYVNAHDNPGSFSISSVSYTGFNSTGYVDSMNVNLSYSGNGADSTPVYFRIVLPIPVVNVNMLLWKATSNVTFHAGYPQNVTIVPEFSSYALPVNTSYMMIAYYGSIQGSYYLAN